MRTVMSLLVLPVVLVCATSSACHQSRPTGGVSPTGTSQHSDRHANGPQEPVDRKITEALAQLPVDDRAAAEQQKTCPVSGELLGSMGVPVKVHVAGRDVFICCEGCRGDLMSDPDKYLKSQGTSPHDTKEQGKTNETTAPAKSG